MARTFSTLKKAFAIVLGAALLLSGQRGIANGTNAVITDMNALVTKVNAKIQKGATAEKDYADELKAFDALYAKYKDLKTDEVAQILMMKAECYIRMGSPALARPFVALIRKRANLDTPAEVSLDFLNAELMREFAFEGHRRTDNIRFGDFFKANWMTPVTPAYRGIFPVPQRELDLNSNLVQNPGY